MVPLIPARFGLWGWLGLGIGLWSFMSFLDISPFDSLHNLEMTAVFWHSRRAQGSYSSPHLDSLGASRGRSRTWR